MKSIFIVIILFSLVPYSAQAEDTKTSTKAFETFEMFCIDQLNTQENIPKLLSMLGKTPLPEEKARGFLFPQKGLVWTVSSKKGKNATERISLILSDTGSCTVGATGTDGEMIKTTFEKMIRHRLLDTDDIGSHTQYIYAITQPSLLGDEDIHGVVLITLSKLNNLKDGIFLNAVPERTMRKERMSVPKWP